MPYVQRKLYCIQVKTLYNKEDLHIAIYILQVRPKILEDVRLNFEPLDYINK